jgi:hypothetical protein
VLQSHLIPFAPSIDIKEEKRRQRGWAKSTLGRTCKRKIIGPAHISLSRRLNFWTGSTDAPDMRSER